MRVRSVDSEGQRDDKAGLLAWLLARGLEGPTRPAAWDIVRAFALVGFVLFAAASGLAWLHLNITKPLKNETIRAGDIYAVSSPIEQDIALLRRWLPSEGKVGYLSEKPELQRLESRLRLAPLLLDYNWSKYDWVLVDYPVRQGQAVIESPSYELVAIPTDAKSFARGMRIYRKKP
jgi:hypothetical protein